MGAVGIENEILADLSSCLNSACCIRPSILYLLYNVQYISSDLLLDLLQVEIIKVDSQPSLEKDQRKLIEARHLLGHRHGRLVDVPVEVADGIARVELQLELRLLVQVLEAEVADGRPGDLDGHGADANGGEADLVLPPDLHLDEVRALERGETRAGVALDGADVGALFLGEGHGGDGGAPAARGGQLPVLHAGCLEAAVEEEVQRRVGVCWCSCYGLRIRRHGEDSDGRIRGDCIPDSRRSGRHSIGCQSLWTGQHM